MSVSNSVEFNLFKTTDSIKTKRLMEDTVKIIRVTAILQKKETIV